MRINNIQFGTIWLILLIILVTTNLTFTSSADTATDNQNSIMLEANTGPRIETTGNMAYVSGSQGNLFNFTIYDNINGRYDLYNSDDRIFFDFFVANQTVRINMDNWALGVFNLSIIATDNNHLSATSNFTLTVVATSSELALIPTGTTQKTSSSTTNSQLDFPSFGFFGLLTILGILEAKYEHKKTKINYK